MTKGYVEKVEMEEEEVDDKVTLKGMRDADFLKKLAQYGSVNNQIGKLEEACKELNKDIRDAFYVAGTSKEGDKTFLHIVTSGKEGEEKAKRTLRELSQTDNIDVKNKTAERYDEKEDAPFITKMMERKLEELYPGYHERHGLKRRWL